MALKEGLYEKHTTTRKGAEGQRHAAKFPGFYRNAVENDGPGLTKLLLPAPTYTRLWGTHRVLTELARRVVPHGEWEQQTASVSLLGEKPQFLETHPNAAPPTLSGPSSERYSRR